MGVVCSTGISHTQKRSSSVDTTDADHCVTPLTISFVGQSCADGEPTEHQEPSPSEVSPRIMVSGCHQADTKSEDRSWGNGDDDTDSSCDSSSVSFSETILAAELPLAGVNRKRSTTASGDSSANDSAQPHAMLEQSAMGLPTFTALPLPPKTHHQAGTLSPLSRSLVQSRNRRSKSHRLSRHDSLCRSDTGIFEVDSDSNSGSGLKERGSGCGMGLRRSDAAAQENDGGAYPPELGDLIGNVADEGSSAENSGSHSASRRFVGSPHQRTALARDCTTERSPPTVAFMSVERLTSFTSLVSCEE